MDYLLYRLTNPTITFLLHQHMHLHCEIFDVKHWNIITVNSENFARILFSRIALKDIFVTFKILDLDLIYLHQ